jgi:beta-mannanase
VLVATLALAIAVVTLGALTPRAPRVVLGVWSGQPWEPDKLDAVTDLLSGSPSLFLSYQSWQRRSFHASDMAEIDDRGAAHVVTWEPDGYTLGSIARGDHDDFIRTWARGAAAWRGIIYLRPMHEMNGDWYSWGRGVSGNTPEQFVDAWRHIHDIFAEVGATNVRWVWSINVRYGDNYPFADLYPGDAYVDWIGIDGYNWGTDPHLGKPRWQSFTDVFGATYQEVTHLVPDKPVMITETASTEHGGDKAAWIREAFFEEIPRFSRIQVVIWFNQPDGASDFSIDSSPQARDAFRDVFRSSEYSGRLP